MTYISLLRKYRCFLYTMVLLLMAYSLYAQEKYGVEFASKGIDPEYRTGVNFFPEKPLTVTHNFSLAFDLSLMPDAGSYFGYVFRLTDEKGQHIDLVFNMRTSSFDLIGGNAYSGISIKTTPRTFFHNWHNIRLDINDKQRTFILSMNGKQISKASITFPAGHEWRLSFGANRYDEAKILDLPPMRLRDVKIYIDDELTHHWPLDEDSGAIARDLIDGATATIENPIWLAYTCRNWQQSADFVTLGNASVAFDGEQGIVYIGGRDSMYYYNCAKNILGADRLEEAQGLPAGNMTVFGGKQLYNFLPDLKKVSTYDGEHHAWDLNADKDSVTRFWHANKYYAPFDSAIYVIGGYGYYHFTNQVQRYSTTSHTWDNLDIEGDSFTPRYMSALGTTPDGDSAFIIGGYGSVSGDQLLNPHNLYDLLLFDAKARTFKKIYQLPVPEKPFVFGSSMVVDTKSQSYYALTFGNDRMQSSLQLIKGSLLRPEYTKLAGEIPFRYFDIRSGVELFYYAKGQKLIAVVRYTPENHVTQIRIYSIPFPPALLTTSPAPSHPFRIWLWVIAGVCLAAFLLVRSKYFFQASQPSEAPYTINVSAPVISDTRPSMTVAISRQETGQILPAHSSRPSILLLGQFTILDKEGTNISKLFSPLVKELFLLLLLHSLPDKKGITSEKINETLWPGRAAKDAKNNRSVNIVKLKAILDRVGYYTLEKEEGKWVLHFDNEYVDIDLQQYFGMSDYKSDSDIRQLINITGRGGLLSETEYSWLDKFKSDLAAEVTLLFINYLNQWAAGSSAERIIAITNCILNFDPLSEEAVMFKCRALVTLRQHAAARAIYNNFVREYKDIYGEMFRKEYQELLVD
ncbi:kelch repeat-containing protein [Chitinophaga sp. S165]|uniref:kelch repeat-containing protein n=1 Tax=Chitinophaga sp. S165 TaxID=2135462 RepID=UPI001304EB90|nr:kelch repeat-containing protein [Chitinophaga sp. S165]